MQDMHVTFLQAAIISVWVAMVMSRGLGGATLTLRFTPMMTGLIVGIVFNDIHNAMITTAAIQLIYMGVFSPGGQMPSEPAIATAVAVPVALLGKMEPTAAVAVAVPVGLLGSYLYQLRFFFNTMIMKLTEKYAQEANSSGLTLSIIILPIICSFVLFVPFMFVALYFGAPIIADVIKTNAGGLVFHILNVIGGGLAAVGIALTIYVIGKKSYIIFFLLAYFMAVMAKPLNITMVTYAIVGAIIAFIFVLAKSEAVNSVADQPRSNSNNNNQIDDDDY
ncbi:PTS sugar transporter subunit IIC [Gilliamella sp. B3781]|nr:MULTISPECIES: PTS sugar transporter subunit IIC [unclassified Gilliamella]MCX8643070.1 PTS sugar transporter subunit IIC [Gilliamella sp. B3835]MCX8708461.1 PTS sugar transporter subunit IIC [Gilliamella sp. B3783]MCX8709717.1 PTS sugar transporter subunit IIC [Gilliamella sp. B3780]MCX8714095.1 PTS sugar transporter subunit IIC [Gilliamella sp. B3781]MCX8717657.1 PTS sugar transporter subunit IIC [Gilliamella sp. B3784]MCX8719994.1 PTS sugar transporter subunit IIC [Gilliamella sp. B3788]